jgi:hypothetical protein
MLGWVIFRADNLEYASKYFAAMMGFATITTHDAIALLYLKENIFFLIIGCVFIFPVTSVIYKFLSKFFGEKYKTLYRLAYHFSLLLSFIVSVSYLVKGSYNPFIYFNF